MIGSPKIPPKNSDLILASGSAVRRQILDGAGLSYSVLTSDVDEAPIKEAMLASQYPPGEIALALANAKAVAVSALKPEAYIIGADQVMIMDDKLYDKPKNIGEAESRLWDMRGKTHYLIGAVTVVQNGKAIWHHMSETSLTVRHFSKDFLDDYMRAEGEDVLSSVGGYKFEGRGSQLFDHVEGDFFSILGLSLLPLLEFLRLREVIVS